jgi:hypothetical protein
VPHASKDRGSFWWRDLLKLCDTYRGIAKCSIGDGSSVLFWSDIWNDLLLQDKFPRLFSFAKDKLISVATFFNTPQMSELFIFHCLLKHGKNIKLFRLSSKEFKLQGKKKIVGSTFGGNLSIHPQSSIIFNSAAYNPQSLSFGFGIQSAQIRLGFFDGCS